MNDFLLLIMDLLKRGVGLAIGIVILFGIGIAAIYLLRRKKGNIETFSWKKAVVILLFVGYIAVLLYATLLRYTSTGTHSYNLHLFRAWREAWNSFSTQSWLNVLLNIALFIPLGAFLPILAKPFKKWYITLLCGFGFSFFIENIQLVFGRGVFDVDDLLANTLGCMLGYCIVMAICKFDVKNKKSFSIIIFYMLLPLLFIVGIVGTFLCYHLQEYGNLAEAPAFTANLKETAWVLECELDDTLQSAPIYQSGIANKEEISSFADTFAEKVGVTFPDVYYYDTSTVYANHSTGDFLTIEHKGLTYEYKIGLKTFDLNNAEVSENDLREMLGAYGITIPQNAEFRYDGDGKHIFTANMISVGDKVIDGELSCLCKDGPVIKEIKNSLLYLELYKDTPIISQSQAYDMLCKGNFNGADYFEHIEADLITVLSCELDYRVDSKGFYQPVYCFEIIADNGYGNKVIIPARK